MRNDSKSSHVAAVVDTNVLVYAYDARDPVKHERAKELLRRLEPRGTGAVTVQVLGEFYTTVTRKILPPMTLDEAAWNVDAFARTWTVLPLERRTAREAIRANRTYQIPYYDGLVWATARLNDIPTVLSEDFTDGQLVEGVRFVNPFAPGFAPATLA